MPKFKLNNIYLKNIFILFIDNILTLAISFVISIFIARYFGPGKFGEINYTLAFITILNVFVNMGFEQVVLRDLGLGIQNENTIIKTSILTRLMAAGICYVLGALVFFLFLNRTLIGLYFVLGLQLFTNTFLILKQWFQVKSINKYTVLSNQISIAAFSILKVLVICLSLGNIYYCYALIISSILQDLILIYCYVKHNDKTTKGTFDTAYCKALIVNSLPLLLESFAVSIYMKTDQIMIGKMLTTKQVGIYSISVTISEMVYFIPTAIYNGMYPKLVEMKRQNKDYTRLLIKIGSLNVFICFLFSVFCDFCIKWLIQMFYGDAYIGAVPVIVIHCWASVFVGLGISHSCYLIFENKQIYSLYSSLCGALCNIVLNYFFIKRFGIVGAAIATLISQFVSSYLIFAIFDRKTFLLRTKSLFFIRR